MADRTDAERMAHLRKRLRYNIDKWMDRPRTPIEGEANSDQRLAFAHQIATIMVALRDDMQEQASAPSAVAPRRRPRELDLD